MRPSAITRPDGSVEDIYYGSGVSGGGGIATQLCSPGTYGYGYPILTVDSAGKKHETWVDGLGRTIEADEPNTSNSLTIGTCYEYDADGHVTTVDALATGQTRTYSYDGLGRVTSVTTPESGTTTYSYNSNGDLGSKKDAAGVTTTYGYDALHRLTSISYSDGTHAIDYYYDQTSYNGLTISNGKGLRTGMSDGSGETAWSYDSMGLILTERKTIAGVTKNISYSYNLDGSLARLTYPDGSYVNYSFNNAGLPTQAVGSNGINYATSAAYWPQGALNTDVHGKVSGGFAGISETWNYNNDLEPTSIVALSSAGTALSLSYSYALPSGNNGTVAGVDNGNSSGRSQTFTYDPLDRILTAQSQATSGQGCWGLNFGTGGLGDDALGNLLSMTPSKCSGPNLSVSVNGYNQITNTGFSYNTDGDLTADGQYSYAYNGATELTSAASVNYTYDGDGLRVEKSNGTLYWRAYTGQVIEETDTSGNLQRAYIFFDKRRIAWRDPQGVHYYFTDPTGSTRVVTDSSGSVCFDADYYPYGQEIDFTNSCSPTYKFAGYEYDSETGNYYAYARYYDPRLGRFLSPDPLDGAIGNPQSLNRYSYVLNDPESLTDPSGACVQAKISGVVIGQSQGGMWEGPCPPPPPPAPQYNWQGVYEGYDSAFQQQVDAIDNGGWGTQGPLAVGGGTLPAPQTPPPVPAKGLFQCASDAAESVSIAADLQHIPGLNSGVGAFATTALFGNPFSGATDLVTSFGTGEGGGHNVFYNMGLGVAAGPTQGFSGFAELAGHPVEGVWGSNPADTALALVFGTEYATGFAEANDVYSGITYGLSLAGCYFGIIH